MQNFARHTRHTPKEIEEQPNVIARKYLTAHFGGYDFDDYNYVKARTHNPPFEAYQKDFLPEENSFVHLMKKGWDANTPLADPSTPKLGMFADSVFAHNEPWRTRAAFLIAHRLEHPNARSLLNAVLREGMDGEPNASHREMEYETWMKLHSFGEKASHDELANIMRGLNQFEDVIEEKEEKPVEIKEVATEVFEDPKPEPEKNVEIVASTPTKTYEEWAKHPDLLQWRRDSLMSPATDAKTICTSFTNSCRTQLAGEILIDHATVEQATQLIPEVKNFITSEKCSASEVVKIAFEQSKLWKN